jgi:poly-gamma-glutamate capsule biosynthesis protein CapA/YwtB (metallophosphatase superfamily)
MKHLSPRTTWSLWLAGICTIFVVGAVIYAANIHTSTVEVSATSTPTNQLAEVISTLTPTVAPSPTPTATATPSPQQITLMFGGDIMLGRRVETNVKANGVSWPLAKIGPTLKSADIAVANLESPFREDYPSTQSGSLVLRGYPPAAQTLEDAGIDLVSLANNHITDMFATGVTQTKAILDARHIQYTGAGLSAAEAAVPAIIERDGVKFGFLSYSYGVNIERADVFYNKADPTRIAADVAALKPKVDDVVVLCHCGIEYQAKENTVQDALAHAAVDAGATLYIGAHPHVPQPVEHYKNGLIVYSLGNLVFDQMPGENRDQSALFKVSFSGSHLTGYSLLPYHIYDYGQPDLLTDPSAKQAVWDLFGSKTGSETF